MTLYRGPYYPAAGCTGGARPGAKALMSYYLGAYGGRGAENLGIYECKRLGSGWSIHAEGRACDLGTKPYNDPGGTWPDWGVALADALRRNSAELGVQLIIFRRKVWSCRYPDEGFRAYTGTDPHDGHLHVELTPAAAQSLTVERIQSVIGGAEANGGMSMLCKRGDKNHMVGALEIQLKYLGHYEGEIDDDYGPKVAAAVLAMRRSVDSDVASGDDFDRWAYAQLQIAMERYGARRYAAAAAPAPTQAQVDAAVAKYLAEHPVKVPTGVRLDLGTVDGTLTGG